MDDHKELASRLLTLAGVIIENASAVAIVGETGISPGKRAATVSVAAADAELLARAAAILLRRC